MSSNKYPSMIRRLFSIWLRHFRVYSRNIISNAISPFIDPLLFIVGIGIGLGTYIGAINFGGLSNLPYITFLTAGIAFSASMFTATFETTYGTFIRLDFDKVYEGILGAPMTAFNIVIGEGLWAGTKGLIFCFAIGVVGLCFGVVPAKILLITPILGFVGGLMFASLGFFVTSFINTINHFNVLFTAVLSPMFFFCGIIFPLNDLPAAVRTIAEILPLTHPVRLGRSITLGIENQLLFWDLLYIVLFIMIIGGVAVKRLARKLID